MLDDILQARQESAALLAEIRALPRAELLKENAAPLLQRAVERKLAVSHSEEGNLRTLIVRSIKERSLAQQGCSTEEIQRIIEKHDCHQTTLVAKKTVLLFFFIEENLGIHLEDAQVAGIQTIPQLAEIVVEQLRGDEA